MKVTCLSAFFRLAYYFLRNYGKSLKPKEKLDFAIYGFERFFCFIY